MHRAAITKLCLTVLTLTAHPADAAGTAIVSGYGQISPGVSAFPADRWIAFNVSSTLLSVGGPSSCHFEIIEIQSTLAAGVGIYGTGNCGGYTWSVACSSQRSFMHLSVVCPTETGAITGSFHLMPRDANPMTYFELRGQVTFA